MLNGLKLKKAKVGTAVPVAGSTWNTPLLAVSGSVIGRPSGPSGRVPEKRDGTPVRSEEHTSELQSLMRISYAVFCLKKKKKTNSKQPKHNKPLKIRLKISHTHTTSMTPL